jgi:predicted nucleic acid-binding protein
LVLDANILIRAVLGRRARHLIETNVEKTSFIIPDAAFAEAEQHLTVLVTRRGGDPEKALALLRALGHLVEIVGSEVYREYESEARELIGSRDMDDWPILATALALECPIWTEDADFFGCGVATWTSNHVEVFLRR